MGAIYRLGLIIAGCYFESAVRNSTQLALYWLGKQDILLGFLPYLIPVFFGYVFALDARNHWSDSLLKNDVMAYVGSTLLTGYPLFISLYSWFSGPGADTTTIRIRIASTVLLLVNLGIAVFVWRSAIKHGHPLSMPWGGVSRRSVGDVADLSEADLNPEEDPQAHEDLETSEEPQAEENAENPEESQSEEEPET